MFMTNTDWEFSDAEAMTKVAHDMWPAIAEAGALSFRAAQTSATTARTYILWPDAETAYAALDTLRETASKMTNTKIIGMAEGFLMVDYSDR
jgi:hypothetical protein